jgi:protein gp37
VSQSYFASGFDLTLRPGMLLRPEQWRKPRRIFVNSMSDLFHRDVPDEYVDRVFEVMERVDHHIYQVLTKRPERMRRFLQSRYLARRAPANIWLGVSVESNEYAWRADMLRDTPAALRFLSMEPLIGATNRVSLIDIHWVIVGGESGPRHRPMDIAWAREIRDRCKESGIAFFFKQWHKAGTGRQLDGRTWDEMPSP